MRWAKCTQFRSVPLQMLRRYWLLSALLDRQWASQRGGDGRAEPQQWRASLGQLAVATPELAPSSGSAVEAARIEAELAPQLRALGPRGQLQHLQGAQPALFCWTLPLYAAPCAKLSGMLAPGVACLKSAFPVTGRRSYAAHASCRCCCQPGW